MEIFMRSIGLKDTIDNWCMVFHPEKECLCMFRLRRLECGPLLVRVSDRLAQTISRSKCKFTVRPPTPRDSVPSRAFSAINPAAASVPKPVRLMSRAVASAAKTGLMLSNRNFFSTSFPLWTQVTLKITRIGVWFE